MYEIDGESLKRIREAAFYSQRQLSIESGVAQATISKYEARRRNVNVRGLTVRRLAGALGVDPSEFASIVEIETVDPE